MAKIKRLGEDIFTTISDGTVAAALSNPANIAEQNNVLIIDGIAYQIDSLELGNGSSGSYWAVGEDTVMRNTNTGNVVCAVNSNDGRFVSSLGTMEFSGITIPDSAFFGYLRDFSQDDTILGIVSKEDEIRIISEKNEIRNIFKVDEERVAALCSKSNIADNTDMSLEYNLFETISRNTDSISVFRMQSDGSIYMIAGTLFDGNFSETHARAEYSWNSNKQVWEDDNGFCETKLGSFENAQRVYSQSSGDNSHTQHLQRNSLRIIDFANAEECSMETSPRTFAYQSDTMNQGGKRNALKVSDLSCEFFGYYTGIEIEDQKIRIGANRQATPSHIGFFDSAGIPQFELTVPIPVIVEEDYMAANPESLNDLKNHYNANTELLLQLRTMVINFGLAKAV